jgi:hypothetical protein
VTRRRDARRRLTDAVRERIVRHGVARFQLSLVIGATAVVGFVLSTALLVFGVQSMAWRYGFAFVGAYVAFLGLLRFWAVMYFSGVEVDAEALDWFPIDPIPDVPIGDGGGFAGGGASGSVDQPAAAASHHEAVRARPSGGDGLDLIDLDEGWLIVVPIVMLAGALIASFVVIWSAPGLLAELILDIVLASRVYRRMSGLDRRAWFETGVRKTWIPALAVGVLLVGGAALLQVALPGTHSMGDVLHRLLVS